MSTLVKSVVVTVALGFLAGVLLRRSIEKR